MLLCPYVGNYSCEKGRQFFQENLIVALERSVEISVIVSISDIPSIKYWQNLGKVLDTAKEKIPKNAVLVIHVLHHWQLLEEIYTQDIRKNLIM